MHICISVYTRGALYTSVPTSHPSHSLPVHADDHYVGMVSSNYSTDAPSQTSYHQHSHVINTDGKHRFKESGRKQLTWHAMHVKDRHVNDTFIDKLTKWYQ